MTLRKPGWLRTREPRLEPRKVLGRDAGLTCEVRVGKHRNIGDGVGVAGDERVPGELSIEDTQNALRLAAHRRYQSLVALWQFPGQRPESQQRDGRLDVRIRGQHINCHNERASVRALSKQMGTSERMIERLYEPDGIEGYRGELTRK